MTELVRRFARGEVSRDEARKERLRGEKQRPKNYIFRFRPPTRDFAVEIKFNKSNVDKAELIQTLSSILEALRKDPSGVS
jgi:hypothetical protein